MATSDEIPNKPHANGINSKLPEGTPLAPQAAKAATTHKTKLLQKLISIPRVFTAARVSVVIVIAAPAILIVAPTGIVTL